MKMKMSLGEGGIKGFLARNVEKIAFTLAVLVVLWVALPDSERKPVDQNMYGPDSIVSTVNSAKTRLATDTAWPLIAAERFHDPDNYSLRSTEDLIPIKLEGYAVETPFDKPPFPPDTRRKDPYILPIEKIEVAVSYGPITVADSTKPATKFVRRPSAEIGDDTTRPLPPKVLERLNKFGAPASAGTTAQGVYIVSLLGQVPIKRQIAEYLATFKDAADYNPTRDFPNYGAGDEDYEWGKYYYEVHRAEILPDGSEGAWKRIASSYDARKLEAKWPQVTELADAKYVDPAWTMALPPLMLRDLRPLALHSEVPSAAQAAEEATAPEEEPEEESPEDIEGPIVGVDSSAEGGVRPPRGSARPPVARPRPRAGGEGSFGDSGYAAAGAEEVDFKLFRFFDLAVQPGKSYVYKVMSFIEDPNDPRPTQGDRTTVSNAPHMRYLDKSVIDRLANKSKDKPIHYRVSEFSQVSPVVRVPATNQVLAGGVISAGTPFKENEDDRTMTRSQEPLVNVMALVWDEKQAMDVPGTLRASRGSVLNFTADTEAIDVSASMLKKLPDYEFQTDNMVLDLRGGEPLGRKSDLSSPGEVLLMDGAGNLMVRRELEDRRAFEENTFPKEPSASSSPVEGDLEGDTKTRPGTRPRSPRSGEGEVNLLEGGPSRPPRREPRER